MAERCVEGSNVYLLVSPGHVGSCELGSTTDLQLPGPLLCAPSFRSFGVHQCNHYAKGPDGISVEVVLALVRTIIVSDEGES